MGGFDKFLEIRNLYGAVLPGWMDCYQRTGRMSYDPYLADWQFTPIEKNVWSDIRGLGLPFYPQMPALNFFLDFGNPFLKIGIECDGKAWHDEQSDKARDEQLAAAGWMIFRLEGHECFRQIELPDLCEDHDSCSCGWQERTHFYGTTSAGVLEAIKAMYFSDDANVDADFIRSTLFQHRSTPETSPRRRLVVGRDPVLIGETMRGYLAELIARSA